MVRAAVCHGFDFSKYDPRSSMQRQKLLWYTQQIQKLDDLRMAELESQRHLCVYGSQGFSAENRNSALDQYMNQREIIRGVIIPGYKPLQTEDIVAAMEQEYAEAVARGEIRGGPAFERKSVE